MSDEYEYLWNENVALRREVEQLERQRQQYREALEVIAAQDPFDGTRLGCVCVLAKVALDR